MPITSNLDTTSKLYISDIPKSNLGNIGGRVVVFIKDHALVLAVASLALTALFVLYFVESYKKSKNEIVGTKLGLPKVTQFDDVIHKTSWENLTFYSHAMTHEMDYNYGKMNYFFTNWDSKIQRLDAAITNGIRVVNHTRYYSVNVDKYGSLYLDGFKICENVLNPCKYTRYFPWKKFKAIRLYPFKDRPDLICVQKNKGSVPEKLIVLEKNKENCYVISWIADASGFGCIYLERFKFNIGKIDKTTYLKKILPLLLLGHEKDRDSAFANLPKEIITLIGKSL